jgi:hypothetical protein
MRPRWASAGDFASAADVAEMGPVGQRARLRAADASSAGRRGEVDKLLRLALPVFARLGASAWTAEATLLAESA